MVFQVITLLLIVTLGASSAIASSSGDQGLEQILGLIKSQNNTLDAAKQNHLSSKHMASSTGYFPDPVVKLNVFGSPIETRNGPQRTNLMVTQPIPWPLALKAAENLAASMANLRMEQIEILLLDLTYQAKSMVFKYVELSEKLESKNKMIVTLSNLSKVVLGRIKVGGASQSEISRINIEVARLTQQARQIESKLLGIQQKLSSMAGGKSIAHLLPTSLNPSWGSSEGFNPETADLSTHPLVRLAKAKISSAQAGIEQAEVKRLPKFGASVSWFQIDQPTSGMSSADAGKDAWAVGASISIPIWSSKYDQVEHSSIAKRSAAQLELRQRELDLKAGIRSVYEEFKSTKDVSSMFRTDIIPQAYQTLKVDQESYTQGGVPFERVIENYIRVVKFEDQLIESRVKQATLKAAIEKLIARSL